MNERSDVQYPMWRKKVDRSLLHYGITPIPGWVCDMWGMREDYFDVYSKSDDRSKISICLVESEVQEGWIQRLRMPQQPFRLSIDDRAKKWLRKAYRMSYMRAIETALRGGRVVEREIEGNPAFWEFVDIEYDRANRTVHLVAHYRQSCSYPATLECLLDESIIDKLPSVVEDSDTLTA